jgi:hypothetical protein
VAALGVGDSPSALCIKVQPFSATDQQLHELDRQQMPFHTHITVKQNKNDLEKRRRNNSWAALRARTEATTTVRLRLFNMEGSKDGCCNNW